MRTVMSFECHGDWLVGSMDLAASKTGLLIVSGGNEIAAGPQRSMARLARIVADAGFPVFRFDRRGIGDSDGVNRGFESSQQDILATRKCFKHHGVDRIVGFGICDGATALAIHDVPIVARVLGNPWLGENAADPSLPSPAAIKARYRERLTDPAAWRALAKGRIDVRKLLRGLRSVATSGRDLTPLAAQVAQSLRARPIPTTIALSDGDGTGITFAEAWKNAAFEPVRAHVRLERFATDAHGFTGETDLNKLAELLIQILNSIDEAAEK